VTAIAAASPRMHGISLGPADLAASRAMKTTRVGGGHPDYVVLEDGDPRAPASGGPNMGGEKPRGRHQQDLWHYTIAKMVDACAAAGIKALYGPFGEPAAAGGDGETSTTLRLPGPRGSVDLELSLDEGSSRLQTFIPRPAPAR